MKAFAAIGVAVVVFPASSFATAVPLILLGNALGVRVSPTMEMVLFAAS